MVKNKDVHGVMFLLIGVLFKLLELIEQENYYANH